MHMHAQGLCSGGKHEPSPGSLCPQRKQAQHDDPEKNKSEKVSPRKRPRDLKEGPCEDHYCP